MGGGPITADIVRSSCFVTFPEHTHAEPVPVDAWYLFAAGLTFLRRLARDRVGDDMHVALLLQLANDEDEATERRYASVTSNRVLQRALQETFECPEKALVLHVIDVGKVRGQKRIHVRPEANSNVSPEPVEPLALVFPMLAVERGGATSIAVEVPTALVVQGSWVDQISRSRGKSYWKNDSFRWKNEDKEELLDEPGKSGGWDIEERDYTKRREGREQLVENGRSTGPGEKVQTEVTKCVGDKRVAEDSDIPVATVVETATTAQVIPSDYVMLELQTGAGLPETGEMASSTYFISSRWAEQADEMSASMVLERPPLMPRATRVGGSGPSTDRGRINASLEDSFVVLERQDEI
uniref:Uncharacterized protein n=1 Tax=Hyaloperonospora arabidopsidis (strain Emoy2) TaxID=559515 RepID=M4BD95_HYAAE